MTRVLQLSRHYRPSVKVGFNRSRSNISRGPSSEVSWSERAREELVVCVAGLLFNKSIVIPAGHFCTAEEQVVVCDTCLHGDCVQTCCPPGQVYAEDILWEPERCADGQLLIVRSSDLS